MGSWEANNLQYFPFRTEVVIGEIVVVVVVVIVVVVHAVGVVVLVDVAGAVATEMVLIISTTAHLLLSKVSLQYLTTLLGATMKESWRLVTISIVQDEPQF